MLGITLDAKTDAKTDTKTDTKTDAKTDTKLDSPHHGNEATEGVPSIFVVGELVPACTPRTEKYHIARAGLIHRVLHGEFEGAAILATPTADGLARGTDPEEAGQQWCQVGDRIEVGTLVVTTGDEVDASGIQHALHGQDRCFRRGRL